MIQQLRRVAAASAVTAAMAATPALAQVTGPSSSQSPYVLPTLPSVSTTSILTVGDSIGGYQMIGIPDGLGALDNGDGTFSVFMNHEIQKTQGAVHDHGVIGSFVSQWDIDAGSLVVNAGDDQIQTLTVSDVQGSDLSGGTSALQMGRLCSADLPAASALYDAATGLGTTERLFLNGEEIGSEGRAFAHVVTGPNDGQSYQLPALGRFSWENSVAAPGAGAKTVVMGMDDSTPGQVYVYVGDKTNTGNEIERAGLTNGSLYGITIPSLPSGPANNEDRTTGIGAAKGVAVDFDLVNRGAQTGVTGAALQAGDEIAGVTEWLRPEDGAWNPNSPNDFYFVTTDRFSNPGPGNEGRSRLWKITFDDVTNPTLGGDVTMLLDGTEGQQMMDNIGFDQFGNILIQEDPGNNAHIAKIWAYSTTADKLVLIAQHDPARFAAPTAPFSRDEESSGIVDITDILDPTGSTGRAYALFDVQAHYANGSLIEGGQLLTLSYDPSQVPEPGTLLLLASGIAGLAAYRKR